MKKILLFLPLIFIFSCSKNDNEDTHETKYYDIEVNKKNISGKWFMQSLYTDFPQNRPSHLIFTDDSVSMYTVADGNGWKEHIKDFAYNLKKDTVSLFADSEKLTFKAEISVGVKYNIYREIYVNDTSLVLNLIENKSSINFINQFCSSHYERLWQNPAYEY